MSSLTSRLFFSARALIVFVFLAVVSAQQCYYPSGDVSKSNDIPCGGDLGACCPEGWKCSNIGLCYYPVEKFWGRYTCTDRSWGSSCPNACTQKKKAPGNEAVLWCSDQDAFCCDGDRSFDCCTIDQKNTDVWLNFSNVASTFDAMGSKPVQSTTLSLEQSATSAVATKSKDSTSTQSATTTVTSRKTSASSQSTSTQSSILAGPPVANSRSQTPSSESGLPTSTTSSNHSTGTGHKDGDPSPPLSSSSKGKLGMIIGIVVGVPIGLLALGLLVFTLWRRNCSSGEDNDAASVHPFYSGRPAAENILDIPERRGAASDFKGPAEMDGSEPYMQRYPIKDPNPFQNRPDLTEPPQHNAVWSRETTMMTLPGAVNSDSDSISPDMANLSPPYTPVSSQSASYRPQSYSEFSPTTSLGAWGPEGGIRPVEMEGSRIPSTIAELPAGTPPAHRS